MSNKELNHNLYAFRKLRKRWYKRLRDEGFIDIEYPSKNHLDRFNDFGGILKNPLSVYRHKYNFFTELYYEISRFLGNHATFLSKIDAKLLELHGEGYTIANISSHLRKNFKHPLNKKGRKGIPYSSFYVHSRLKVLKLLIYVYADTEDMESVKKSWQLL